MSTIENTATTPFSRVSVDSYVNQAAQVPDEAILGHMVVFEVPVKVAVKYEDMVTQLESSDLSTEFLRDKTRPVDAYKRAVRELFEHKFSPTNELRTIFTVRSVGRSTKSASTLHVMREVAQYGKGQPKRLVYDPLVKLNFDRSSKHGPAAGGHVQKVRVPVYDFPLTAQQQQVVDDGLNELVRRINFNAEHVAHAGIRDYIRDYLRKRFRAFAAKKSGGMYFISRDHADELRRLKDWANSIGCNIITVPLLDLIDAREMLADALSDDISSRAESKMAEVAAILGDASRTIKQETYTQMLDEIAEIWDDLHAHSDTLGARCDAAAATLTLSKKQVLALARRVDN